MGRKALVDFSLIREICENVRTKKKKFKGKLDLGVNNGSTKAAKKGTQEIRRLLVAKAFEKASKKGKIKKKKRQPARFSQTAKISEESGSSTESESSSGGEDASENSGNSDEDIKKSDEDGNSGGDSDFTTDANGET